MARIGINGKKITGRQPRKHLPFAGLTCPKTGKTVVTDADTDPGGKLGAAVAVKHALSAARPQGRHPDPEFDELFLVECTRHQLPFRKTRAVIDLGIELARRQGKMITEDGVKWRIDALRRQSGQF